MNQGAFFQDMAVVMAIAGVAAALFSRLKIPKVFGYIFVGIVMNEHTWGGSFLLDVASVSTISQLGIVFLMLTMGLDFSTSEMKKIKSVTMPTAIVDTIVMTWLGYTVGTKLLGWNTVPSLFLGVAICDSATTLLAKVIGEMGWSDRPFVRLAMGTSVCEDIICVGLIALVTGVANGSGMSLGSAALSLGGLSLFFFGMIVFGLIFVPRLLVSVSKRKDDEALLLTIVGFCFFVSWLAFKLDYSLALGAFLVGIIGAASDVRDKLHKLVAPLRAMFAAMFFVSIGLLVDPMACLSSLGSILLLSLVVIVGKGVNCFMTALLAGESIKTSVQLAMSLAQIGEFAFMVALLYVGLSKDMNSPMFQVAIGVSLVTTVLSPLMIRYSEAVGEWAQVKCPTRVAGWLTTYRTFLDRYRKNSRATGIRKRVRGMLIGLGVIAALNMTVAVFFMMLDRCDWSRFSYWLETYDRYIFIVLMNLFFIVMFVAVSHIARHLARALGEVLVGRGDAKWQMAVRSSVEFVVFVAIVIAYGIEVFMINTAALPVDNLAFEVVMLALLALAGVFGWRFFRQALRRAKLRFDEALAADERLRNLGKMMTVSVPAGAIHRLTIPVGSRAIGATVVTLDIRAKTGASVVSVIRNGNYIRNVGPEVVFQANDVLVALGEPVQIAALESLLSATAG